jgi:hypothetical protein
MKSKKLIEENLPDSRFQSGAERVTINTVLKNFPPISGSRKGQITPHPKHKLLCSNLIATQNLGGFFQILLDTEFPLLYTNDRLERADESRIDVQFEAWRT